MGFNSGLKGLSLNNERRIYSTFLTAKQIIKQIQRMCSLEQGCVFAFKIQTLISWHQLIQAKYRQAHDGKCVYTCSTSNLLLYIIEYSLCCIFSKNKCIVDLQNKTSANCILSAAYSWPQTSSYSELQFSSDEENPFSWPRWFGDILTYICLIFFYTLKSFLPMICHFYLVFLWHQLLLPQLFIAVLQARRNWSGLSTPYSAPFA